MSYHTTIVLGRLGQDPVTRQLPSGSMVCNASLAVGETWIDKATNEKREKTTWYKLSIFGKQAETFAQYMKKGSQVMAIGTVESRAYLDKDGEARSSLELNVREFRFVGGGNDYDSRDDSHDYEDVPF